MRSRFLPILLASTGALLMGITCLAETSPSENWRDSSQKRQKSQREWYRRWRQNPPRQLKDAEALEQELLRNPDRDLQLKILGRGPSPAGESQSVGSANRAKKQPSSPGTTSAPSPEPVEIQDAPPAREERFPGKSKSRLRRSTH